MGKILLNKGVAGLSLLAFANIGKELVVAGAAFSFRPAYSESWFFLCLWWWGATMEVATTDGTMETTADAATGEPTTCWIGLVTASMGFLNMTSKLENFGFVKIQNSKRAK